MGVRELGHVVLYVRDLERSRTFYRDVLDWPAVADVPLARTRATAFSGGRTHHELLLIEVGPGAAPLPAGRHVGMYHFGVKVGDRDDDLRAVASRLADAGTPIVGAADHTVTHSLYVLDPDGNEVEIYIDVADVNWRTNPELILSPTKPLQL